MNATDETTDRVRFLKAKLAVHRARSGEKGYTALVRELKAAGDALEARGVNLGTVNLPRCAGCGFPTNAIDEQGRALLCDECADYKASLIVENVPGEGEDGETGD